VDNSTFWNVIDTARASAGQDTPFHQALEDHLAAYAQQEILGYQQRFDEAHRALNRWDVWAAAYLIGGGCSDDSFIDFRAGLIAQGRGWYGKAAASPDTLAGHPAVASALHRPWDSALFYEEVNYAASRAFDRVSGVEHAFYDAWGSGAHGDHSPADMGEEFDFDDDQQMRQRLPRLSALCLRSGSA
jgi:hypothetical protein